VLAAGIALIVIGLVLVLFLGFAGFIVAAVGLVVLVMTLLNFRRRSAANPP
jgi:glucose dehydrogenase